MPPFVLSVCQGGLAGHEFIHCADEAYGIKQLKSRPRAWWHRRMAYRFPGVEKNLEVGTGGKGKKHII